MRKETEGNKDSALDSVLAYARENGIDANTVIRESQSTYMPVTGIVMETVFLYALIYVTYPILAFFGLPIYVMVMIPLPFVFIRLHNNKSCNKVLVEVIEMYTEHINDYYEDPSCTLENSVYPMLLLMDIRQKYEEIAKARGIKMNYSGVNVTWEDIKVCKSQPRYAIAPLGLIDKKMLLKGRDKNDIV